MRRVTVVTFLLACLAGACRADEGSAAPAPTTVPPTTEPVPETTTTSTTAAPATSASAAAGTVGGEPGGRGTAPPPAAAAAPCDVPAGYPEPWPERPRYTAHLTVEPGKRLVTGDVAVRFVPTADTDRLVFRLWPNAPRIGRAGGKLEITAATVGGPAGSGAPEGAGRLAGGRYEAGGAVAGKPGTIFVLPGAFPAGRPVDARLEFRITLPGAVNDRVATAGRAVRLGSAIPVLSWIRGDGWQTSPATPLNAESAASEVADWDVTVAAPAGYTTLATGRKTPPDPASSFAGTRFTATAVRDWAATVAPMRIGRAEAQQCRTEVVVGVAEGAAGDPATLATRHARALDALAARFGEYPYDRLTVGVTGGLSGGIEFPTHIFLGSGSGPQAAIHLVHEVAHQWFYGLVGNDQYRDPWIDEGFATYAESRVDGDLARQRAKTLPAAGRGHLGESMAYWGRNGGAYYVSVYIGGLQALARYGDRIGGYGPLDCAVRRLVRDHAYTVARPSDVEASLAAQTGIDPTPTFAPLGVR